MTTSIFTDFRTVLIIILIIVATIVSAYSFKFLTEKYIKKLVLTKHIDPT